MIYLDLIDSINPNSIQNQQTDDASAQKPISNTTNWLIDSAISNMHHFTPISADITHKYEKEGLNWNPEEYYSGSLDRQLATNQSRTSKWVNGIGQALVSEAALGTIKAFPDLIDAIGQTIFRTEHDYNNPVSRLIENWQNHFNQEIAPVYTTPGVDIAHGGLGDAGWWASQVPSIMSSITMLIPSKAAISGTKLIGKGIKTGTTALNTARKLRKGTSGTQRAISTVDKAIQTSRLQKKFAGIKTSSVYDKLEKGSELLGTAILSRTIENYQEAHQVYDDMYQVSFEELTKLRNDKDKSKFDKWKENNKELLKNVKDLDNIDEIAKTIARESADKTFRTDYINTVFDLVQLMTLRNLHFNAGKNAPSSAKLYRQNKNRIRYAGLSKAERQKAIDSRKFTTKTKDFLEDIFVGGKTVLSVNASEGVEEAVNYIAQQEGLNLGHVILGTEKDKGFANRLNEYLQAPSLWESAMFGVLGGVAFQGLGSAYNSMEARIHNAKENKNKTNNKTQEQNRIDLWETAEMKRRKADMDADENDLNIYLDRMHTIVQDGINPYERDADGNTIHLNDTEKEIMKDKAYNDFISSVTMRNLNNGNYELLKEYLTSDEVRDVFVNKGIMSSTQAQQTQQAALSKMKQVEDLYYKNLSQLNTVSATLNANRDEYIPMEYLQIIATENVNKQLSIDEWQKELDAWVPQSQEQLEFFKDKLEEGVDYKSAIKLVYLTKQLGEFEAEKKALLKDKETLGTISGQAYLSQLNTNIETFKEIIYNLDSTNGTPNLLFAIENGLLFDVNENGDITLNDNDEHKTFVSNLKELATLRKKGHETVQVFDEEGNSTSRTTDNRTSEDFTRISELDEYFEKIDKRLSTILDKEAYTKDLYSQAVGLAYEGEKDIRKVAADLYKTYYTIADLETAIAVQRKQIALTEDEISNKVNTIHNEANQLRKKAVDTAMDRIRKLADKYGSDKVLEALRERYTNPSETKESYFYDDEESKSDSREFDDILDILNLNSASNTNLAIAVENILETYDAIKAAQKVNSTTSENSNTATQNKPTTNNTQSTQNTHELNANTQKSQNQSQQTPKKKSNELKDDNNETYGVLHKRNDTEKEYDLEVVPNTAQSVALFNNSEYFDKNGVILTQPFVVTERPVVEVDDKGNIKVLKKGKLDKRNNQQTKPNQTLSTGGQDPTHPSDIGLEIPPGDLQNPAVYTVLPTEINSTSLKADNAVLGKISVEILDEYKKAKTKGVAVDWETKKQEYINKYKDSVEDKVKLEHTINSLIKVVERINNKKETVVDKVIALSSWTTESKRKGEIEYEYQEAADKLVEKYIEDIADQLIDGKYYLRLENLLRYCNENTQSVGTATILYDKLYAYLTSSNKYVIVDTDKQNIVENASKDVDTRIEEIFSENEYNIGIKQIIQRYERLGLQKEIDKILDILNNLNVDDRIEYSRTDGALKFTINNIEIGALPYPKINDVGARWQYNEGWKTEVFVNNNGIIESEFLNWLVETFVNEEDFELKAIVEQYGSKHLTTEQQDELIKQFKINKSVQKAKELGLINPTAKPSTLLHGLKSLTSSCFFHDGSNVEKRKQYALKSLQKWFEKVNDSFDEIERLALAPKGEVIVSDIFKGNIIETDNPLPVSRAIAEKNKNNIALVATNMSGKFDSAGEINIDEYDLFTKAGKSGHTRLLLLNGTNYPDVLNAYPQNVSSKSLSNTARNIVNSCLAEIDRLIETNGVGKELNNFLQLLLNSYNGNIGLFRLTGRGVWSIKEKNSNTVIGFNINYINNEGKEETYTVRYGDNNTDKIAQDIKTIIQNNARFNLNINYIQSDKENKKLKGFAKRNDKGQFVISIPNQNTFIFDSFNDFVLNNDVILVNTEPGSYDNNRQGITDSEDVYMKVKTIETSPVKENGDDSFIKTLDNTAQKVYDVLTNGNKDTAAKEIAKIILGDQLKELKINGIIFDLFPKSLIFVNKFIGRNAATNVNTTNTSYIGNNEDIPVNPGETIVGLEFMQMINGSINDKKQAVRKLIHERLHQILHTGNNTKYIEQIREIFDEFKRKTDNEHLQKYFYNDSDLAKKQYWSIDKKTGKEILNEDGLEEFLVDSLTSLELQYGLNNIQADVAAKDSEHKSLLQKIADFLCDLFGWKVNKGSLFEKELKLLADEFKDIKKEEKTEEKQNNTIDKNKPKQLEINFNESATQEQLDKENEIVSDKNNKTENEVEQNDIIDDDNTSLFFSTTTETMVIPINNTEYNVSIPSIPAFIERFSIEEQQQIKKDINNGTLETMCK